MSPDQTGDGPARSSHRRSPDPLGRQALFSTPVEQATPDHDSGRAGGPAAFGKRALYSTGRDPGDRTTGDPTAGGRPGATAVPTAGADETVVGDNPLAERGRITVTCSVCEVVSRIGVLDFVVYQLPMGYWLPRGRFGHRMTCPSCRRRVWAGVTLR
ncbi:MAG TPA: hypothetical protein VHW47_04390 [Acidimicrobiales bacterium]|nr:hypothetical protein [Acidimicrobiales bacterium]